MTIRRRRSGTVRNLRSFARLSRRWGGRLEGQGHAAKKAEVAKLLKIAAILDLTVEDLNDKPPDEPLSPIRRRMLRDALDALTDLLDLEDPALDEEPPERSN